MSVRGVRARGASRTLVLVRIAALAAACAGGVAGCYGPQPSDGEGFEADGPGATGGASRVTTPGATVPTSDLAERGPVEEGERTMTPEEIAAFVRQSARAAEPQPMPWQPPGATRGPTETTPPGNDGDPTGASPPGGSVTLIPAPPSGGTTSPPGTGTAPRPDGTGSTPPSSAPPAPSRTCAPGESPTTSGCRAPSSS